MARLRSRVTESSLQRALSCVLVAATLLGCGSHQDDETGSDGGSAGADAGAQSRDRFYVTMAGTHEVWSFDDETHEVLSTIPVGKGPAIILATPDGKQLYTANWLDFTVSAIDVATEKVESLKMSGRPYVIAMAPDGDHVYAGLQSNQIVAIDTATREIDETFATSELPASIIVSADGKILYVATIGGNLRALNAADGSEARAPIRVGAAPAWITISPDGKRVYTLNFLSDDVSVVDTESWSVVATIPTGAGSQAIIGNVTPDSSKLYVTNYGTGELMGIDAASNELTQTIALDGRPVGVQFNDDASRVYVTDFGPKSLEGPANSNFLITGSFGATDPGQVSVFDRESGELVGEKIPVDPGPTSVVFIPAE